MGYSTFFKQLLFVLILSGLSNSLVAQKYTGLTGEASDGAALGVIFDGNTGGARWQDSNNEDNSWIIVDLGEVKEVGSIRIFWETANAKAYNISFSEDGTTYDDQMDFTDMAPGERTDAIPVASISCRYIKWQGVERQMPYGYSIFEFEVYAPVQPELTKLNITPKTAIIDIDEAFQFNVTGEDQVGSPFALVEETVWSVSGGTIDQNGLFTSSNSGYFEVEAVNDGVTASAVVEVVPENNIALNKTYSASAGTPAEAFDGNMGSRWIDTNLYDVWIMVDLEGEFTVTDMIVRWEGANAKDYIIEKSLDGDVWETVIIATDKDNSARADRFYGLNEQAQYLRLSGIDANTGYGYSIWEWEVYGSGLTVGINSSEGSDAVAVYPNPFADVIYISSENIEEVKVYNLTGQLVVKDFNGNGKNSFDLSALDKGIYILEVNEIGGKVTTTRIVKL